MFAPSAVKRKPQSHVTIRSGQIEFLRSNAGPWEARDLYRTVLAMSWPRFAVTSLAVYLVLNIVFALLYLAGGDCIAGMPRGSFSSAFFFSVQTLSTVGYGHLYPDTIYGHVLTTIEIVAGMFLTAVVTGLIFVRFSRPMGQLLFSESMVVCNFNGRPTLQFRVANLHRQPMVEARFRLMMLRRERTPEDDDLRRFHDLKLEIDHLITFPMAVTLRHHIDGTSPLHGISHDKLKDDLTRFMVSVVCTDTVIQAPVQNHHDYTWRDVRFAERFVEIYRDLDDGRMEVDYALIHDTEPEPATREI
jgi:inward rectifier potassium channel